MSPNRPTSIILLIFILPGNQAQSINPDELCNSSTLVTLGGKVLLQSTRMYKVVCEPGYVTPLTSPNQSFIYRCKNGEMNVKMPHACVERRIPYRKVEFEILLVETKKTLELCGDAKRQTELISRYNESVEKSTSVIRGNKGYITNCLTPKYPNDYVHMNLAVTKLLKRNVSSDLTPGGRAHVVLNSFSQLVECMKDLGYLTTSEAKNVSLVYTAENSVIGYHCDDHLQMRIDGGSYVCVGCGKGFWMDTKKQCHPCGPGFYNPLETAMECQPCPVQYISGLWSADSLAECFKTQRDQLASMSRLLERVLIPVAYLFVIIIGVAVLHKSRSESEAKSNRLLIPSKSSYEVREVQMSRIDLPTPTNRVSS